MASITVGSTTFSFFTLRGEPEPVGVELQEITRPGENGHAYWELGKRGRPFDMLGYADYASLSDAAVGFESMKAKQGKIATLLDDRGRTYFNVAILAVEKQSIRPVAGVVGGLLGPGVANALLVARFRMQCTK